MTLSSRHAPLSERGYTLPLALVALMITCAIVRCCHERALHLVRVWRILSQTREAQREILSDISSLSLAPGRCIIYRAQIKNTSHERHVCFETLGAYTASPPVAIPPGRIDWAGVFLNFALCSGRIVEQQRRSFDRPLARSSCALPQRIQSPFLARENILVESSSELVGSGMGPSWLGSPGSLTVRGTLGIDHDAIIIGGGDISIGTILTSSKNPVTATIISAQGDVEVKNIVGPVSLVVVGTRALHAPRTPLPSSIPFPPTRPPGLFSVTTADGDGT